MKRGVFSKKSQKLWIIKTVDRSTRRTVAGLQGIVMPKRSNDFTKKSNI
ncbi:hypothetical protein [Holospora obtusa]|nr:hypothetical protein [Holospora obtusa]